MVMICSACFSSDSDPTIVLENRSGWAVLILHNESICVGRWKFFLLSPISEYTYYLVFFFFDSIIQSWDLRLFVRYHCNICVSFLFAGLGLWLWMGGIKCEEMMGIMGQKNFFSFFFRSSLFLFCK